MELIIKTTELSTKTSVLMLIPRYKVLKPWN